MFHWLLISFLSMGFRPLDSYPISNNNTNWTTVDLQPTLDYAELTDILKLPSLHLGDKCNVNSECEEGDINSYCNSTGICACRYRNLDAFGKCLPYIPLDLSSMMFKLRARLGEHCKETSECILGDPYSYCSLNGICTCTYGNNSDGSCINDFFKDFTIPEFKPEDFKLDDTPTYHLHSGHYIGGAGGSVVVFGGCFAWCRSKKKQRILSNSHVLIVTAEVPPADDPPSYANATKSSAHSQNGNGEPTAPPT